MLEIFQKGGAVMIVLVGASVLSWGILIERTVFFLRAPKRLREALRRAEGFASEIRDPVVLEKELVHLGRLETSSFEAWLWLLALLGSLGPLLGLQGTVLGMIRSFSALGKGEMAGASLALGISEALYTTAGGLMVAIPCLIGYAAFRRLSDRAIGELEADLNLLLSRGERK